MATLPCHSALLRGRQRHCTWRAARCLLPHPPRHRRCHGRAAGADAIATINFYRFRAPECRVSDDELRAQASKVESFCASRGVVGTVILATEGVNGSVAGELEAVRDAVKQVGSMPSDQWPDAAAAPELVKNEEIFSTPRVLPFKKLKVKIKPEIVTMRADKPLDMSLRGEEVSPEDWDDVIAADDTIVLDTRNTFESQIGTFAGAVIPEMSKFSEFPDWAEAELIPARSSSNQCGLATTRTHRRVAMFCTGGIRCEKASAYLLQHGGYKPGEVLQLKGGIQSYLTRNKVATVGTEHCTVANDRQMSTVDRTLPETASSSWSGMCFVFDERTAVDGAGESIAPAVAERLALQLGPRAGKSLRKRLAVAAGQTKMVQVDQKEGSHAGRTNCEETRERGHGT